MCTKILTIIHHTETSPIEIIINLPNQFQCYQKVSFISKNLIKSKEGFAQTTFKKARYVFVNYIWMTHR